MRESWEKRNVKSRTGEEYRDRLGELAAGGVERVYIQLATRVPEHAAACLERLEEV